MKKNNSGITLIALIITIIILIIIVSISVHEGKELIAKSKVQSLETNMLTIQAKAKAYAEEIDAKIWTESDNAGEADENGYTPKDRARNTQFTSAEKAFTGPINIENQEILTQLNNDIATSYVAYTVTGEALSKIGLDEIKDETYVVVYSKNNYKLMDVIYPNGVKYENETRYTLSNLQSALEE